VAWDQIALPFRGSCISHSHPDDWQKLLEHLLSDKEMLADVRLKFSDLYREIEASADPFDVPLMLSLAPEDQKTFLVNVLKSAQTN